jgi:hypothetical protein
MLGTDIAQLHSTFLYMWLATSIPTPPTEDWTEATALREQHIYQDGNPYKRCS